MEPLRAGYVSLGTEFYVPERLHEITADCERQLAEAGIELARTDPVFALGQEERAIRELKAEDWDFLIVNVINWIDPRAASRLLLAFRDRPLVLYSHGGFTENGTLISPAAGAGSTALRYPLERWRVKFKYLFNGPDMPMDVEGICKFGRAAKTARMLKHARVGLVGYNDMGLYTTGFNPTTLRDRIGPEIESIDMLQLERQMDALDAEAVRTEVARVTANWEYPVCTWPRSKSAPRRASRASPTSV
jgi:L-fucose isomerase-like protein